jgi:hypothetical protein
MRKVPEKKNCVENKTGNWCQNRATYDTGD